MKALWIGMAATLLASSANAALVISTDATNNVACDGGVCSATAADAVLNVGDVTTMLASAPLTIQSGSQAQDILVEAPFSWTSSNKLTLDANQSITVKEPIADSGSGSLTIKTNLKRRGDNLRFSPAGNITFQSTSNTLSINGTTYKLENSISSLANDIAANSHGFFALASTYDAEQDGVYTSVPIPTEFFGDFNGLGNSIANLSINDHEDLGIGLFAGLAGTLQSVHMENVNIQTDVDQARVGGFVGDAGASMIEGVTVTGIINVENGGSSVGGLIGDDGQTLIENCSTDVDISGGDRSQAGGLAGSASGGDEYRIVESFSAGSVKGGFKSDVGGLVGKNEGGIRDSYSTASVKGGSLSNTGGLVGYNFSENQDSQFFIIDAYSNGSVTGGKNSFVAGFVGDDLTFGSIRNSYWDTTASGQLKGAGNIEESGITGLTTEQFRAGLPEGFSKKVWSQKQDINNGYPYLTANPPAK